MQIKNQPQRPHYPNRRPRLLHSHLGFLNRQWQVQSAPKTGQGHVRIRDQRLPHIERDLSVGDKDNKEKWDDAAEWWKIVLDLVANQKVGIYHEVVWLLFLAGPFVSRLLTYGRRLKVLRQEASEYSESRWNKEICYINVHGVTLAEEKSYHSCGYQAWQLSFYDRSHKNKAMRLWDILQGRRAFIIDRVPSGKVLPRTLNYVGVWHQRIEPIPHWHVGRGM